MLRFVLRRVALLVPTLLGISVISFLLLYLVPGDVVDILMGTESGDPARLAELRRILGLDRPLVVRYGEWLWSIAQGDLGRSFVTRRPVVAEIQTALPATLQLTAAALGVAVAVGIPLGILAAVRRGHASSVALSVVGLLALSMPHYWLGILLLLFASLYLGWFPPQGLVLVWQAPWSAAQQLLFPALSLGLGISAMVMRMTRSCLLEVMRQDFIRTARAKGVLEARVLAHHALRNALVPIVTLVGLQFGALLGGTVVAEAIFSIPGMGTLVLRSIAQRDFPLVQGILLVTGVGVVLVNLVVDVCYALLDPRLRRA